MTRLTRNAKLIASRHGWRPVDWVYIPSLPSLAGERGRVINYLRGLSEGDLIGEFSPQEREVLLRPAVRNEG